MSDCKRCAELDAKMKQMFLESPKVANGKRKRCAELDANEENGKRHNRIKTHCPVCGPDTKIDADLCCTDCGREATIEGLANRAQELEVILARTDKKFLLGRLAQFEGAISNVIKEIKILYPDRPVPGEVSSDE